MTGVQADVTQRWERAQAVMQQYGLDLLLVTPGSDFFYLTGQHGHLSERLTALVLPREGRPALVVGELEEATYSALAGAVDIRTWRDTEDPMVALRRVASPVSVSAVGVSEQMWSVFLLRLQETYRGATWYPAGVVLRPMRSIKDARELDAMREAGRRTDEVWEAFLRRPLAGLSERAVADYLTSLLRESGMEPSFPTIVAAGRNSASPHHEPGSYVIAEGDPVTCDFGGIVDGYCSDITRVVHVGEPSARVREIYNLVRRAHDTAFRAIRPGVTCEAIDEAARWVIEAAGYGQYFIHRTGHGLGIDIHEEPYIVKGNRQVLAPGMVFSDEPGIYLPGEFGVRVEDCVIVTVDGAERLTNCSRDLQVGA